MLGWRLLVSAVLIPAFIGLFFLDIRLGPSAPILLALTLLIAIRSCWELVGLFRTRSFEPDFQHTAFLSALVVASAWFLHLPDFVSRVLGRSDATWGVALSSLGRVDSALVFGLAVLWLLALNASRYQKPGGRMETLGAEILIVAYAGLLLSLTARLRWVQAEWPGGEGYFYLASVIIAAKCGDTGAYTFGRLFGRHKMSPILSPGKTWEGAVGALVFAGLGSWAWLTYGPRLFDMPSLAPTNPVVCVGYGILIAVAGIVGDLCESLIKRDLGKKDAASLLPGFGGLVDLTDSVVYAGPIAYLFWLLLPLFNSPAAG
jgi:phosphatidate cytidylyltransferase